MFGHIIWSGNDGGMKTNARVLALLVVSACAAVFLGFIVCDLDWVRELVVHLNVRLLHVTEMVVEDGRGECKSIILH